MDTLTLIVEATYVNGDTLGQDTAMFYWDFDDGFTAQGEGLDTVTHFFTRARMKKKGFYFPKQKRNFSVFQKISVSFRSIFSMTKGEKQSI